jgi:hypothetical protein
MSTIELERYIAAFEAWARVSSQGSEIARSIAQVATYLRSRHAKEVDIEVLCKDALAWLRQQRLVVPDVGKSCLLGRMIYGGEDLRTRPCPLHGGRWSGCTPEACPGGCNYGINVTGWLPNDFVDEWPQRTRDPQLDQLADVLRESWSDDHVAVYADRLIALGEPRGELITVELALRQRPSRDAAARFDALLETCFGDIRSTDLDEFRSTRGIGERATVRLGFLEAVVESAIDIRKIYNSRNGRYLRTMTMRGDTGMLNDSLAMLSIRPHIWLGELAIIQTRAYQPDSKLGEEATEDLFDAMPNLTSLFATGHRLLSLGELSSVRRLRISELDTVSFVSAPRLEYLELSAETLDPQTLPRYLDELWRRAPALRAVEVSRRAVGFTELSHPLLRIV